jgi:hypothetical protein
MRRRREIRTPALSHKEEALGEVHRNAAPLGRIGYAVFGGSRLLVFGAAGSVAAVSASVVSGLSPGNAGQAVAFTSANAFPAATRTRQPTLSS